MCGISVGALKAMHEHTRVRLSFSSIASVLQNVWNAIIITLNFVPRDPIDDISTFVGVMVPSYKFAIHEVLKQEWAVRLQCVK